MSPFRDKVRRKATDLVLFAIELRGRKGLAGVYTVTNEALLTTVWWW